MDSLGLIKQFVSFASKELRLKTLPQINYVGKVEDKKQAFGHYISNKKSDSITIRVTGRHPIDVMRTLAHELYHYKQRTMGVKESERTKEDEANAIAGRIIRKYDTIYPNSFKARSIPEEVVSAVPANAMGVSSPSNPFSAIAQPERILGITRRKQPKGLSDIIGKRATVRQLRKDRERGV